MSNTRKMTLNEFCIDCSNDYVTIPDALVTYARDTIFSTWQILERQLDQVDPALDPDIYQALDDRANTLFNSWLQFRYVGRQC